MAFCSKCGSRIDDNATFCQICGTQVTQNENDDGGFGWNLFGFCCPILITFIMYLVWMNSRPKRAEAICHGALVGIVISVVFSILSALLGAVA